MKLHFSVIFLFLLMLACSDSDNLDRADQLFRKGEYKEAIAAYNEYLEMKPANEIAIYNRGRAYEELGQYDKAIADFKKVIEMNPKNENAILSYGKQFFREKDYQNAAYQFEKAYKLNKSSSTAATLLARALHRSGEIEKAMEYYNIAINNDRKNGEAFMYRGALKLFLKQGANGCNDIKQAINLGYTPAEQLYDEYCQ